MLSEDVTLATKKPAETSNVSKDDLLKYYAEMLLIRRFEEKAGQLYGMGLIGGFCHQRVDDLGFPCVTKKDIKDI